MLVLNSKHRGVRRTRPPTETLVLKRDNSSRSSDSHVQNHQNDCLNKQGAQSGIVIHPTYNMPPPPAVMSSQDYAYTTAALIKQDTGQYKFRA